MGRLYENIGMLHNSLIKTMFEDVMGIFYENDMRMFHDDVIGKLYGDFTGYGNVTRKSCI